MYNYVSRRDALKGFLLLGAVSVVEPRKARADAAPHLSPTDPAAAALGYQDNAKTVDAKQFPTYQVGQSCNTCTQLQGTSGQPWRACNLFPGKVVSADGWCKVWVKKP
jgi:hypothetical protein